MGEIQLFLVRVWRQRRGFRAAVRGAGGDEPRLFTAPEQVGEFLRQAVTPTELAPDRDDAAGDARGRDGSTTGKDAQRRAR